MESFLAIFLLSSCLLGLSSTQEMSSSTMHGMASTPSTMMGEQKVDVIVYYETLCPDSIKFITKQVAPLYKGLHDHMNLKLVPYGKATTTVHNETHYTFQCHHNVSECYGNKIHACALNKLSDMNKKVDFVNCTMATVNRGSVNPEDPNTYPGKSCTMELQIREPPYDEIERCARSSDGDKLLYEAGEETSKFQKPLQSVPAATVMGKGITIKDYGKEGDLKTAVCDKLSNKNTLKACMSGAGMAANVLMFTLLAAAFSRILA